MLSPRQKRRVRQIIPFGIIWLVFGILYSLVERGLLGNFDRYPSTNNVYDFQKAFWITSILCLLVGLVIGAIESFFLKKIFMRRSFGVKLLAKSLIYLVFIILFLSLMTFVANSVVIGKAFYDQEVIDSFVNFISNFAFWSVVTYIAVVIGVSIFYSEVSDNMGDQVLGNFFTGKYHVPVEESRIFMFLDIKSSTSIAEKLGHLKYFKLLNRYYADLTNDIIDTNGEIYQYVGDEIIVSWPIKKGIENANCIQCFYKIKERIKNLSAWYKKEFRLVPEFKAGFHAGSVTTGEIGILKKEIIFTGDVLNTCARIQGLCNHLDVDILLSDHLISLLENDHQYQFTYKTESELRGKNESVKLFTVSV